MPCYHPLKGFVLGSRSSGKKDLKVVGYEADYIGLDENGIWQAGRDAGSFSPYLRYRQVIRDFVQIPCGQCIGCRLDYSRQWMQRCLLENSYHENACFLTLTYTDQNVPRSFFCDSSTGEILNPDAPWLTLEPRHLTLFWKRLRKWYGEELRYYACGEYGSNTFRPHYHAIVFGLNPDRLGLEDWSRNFRGDRLYLSRVLTDDVWKLGNVMVGEVNEQTCAYVSRYVMKKLKGEASVFYDEHGLVPPFTRMSTHPGLGNQYFQDHPDIYEFDKIHISTPQGGKSFRPPRYYDKLYDCLQPEEMAEIKQARQAMAEAATQLKLSRTDLSYLELLAAEEAHKKEQIKSLKRSI